MRRLLTGLIQICMMRMVEGESISFLSSTLLRSPIYSSFFICFIATRLTLSLVTREFTLLQDRLWAGRLRYWSVTLGEELVRLRGVELSIWIERGLLMDDDYHV